jgi:predicted kinase
MKVVIRTARYDTGRGQPVFEKGKFTKEDVYKRALELAEEQGVEVAGIRISLTFTGSAQFVVNEEKPNEGDDAEAVHEVRETDAQV